jgi:POT family proton-dependent oligopeptide transporter
MGINLGAAISPLLCGYIGETYSWHYGFGLATIGMLVGLAVFVMPTRLTQTLIGAAAVASAIGLFWLRPDNLWAIAFNIFVAIALVAAAVLSCAALQRGGLPSWAGRPPRQAPRRDRLVYAGILLSIPIFALMVSGFSPLRTPKISQTPPTEEENVAWLRKYGVSESVIDEARRAGDLSREMKARGSSLTLIDDATIDELEKKGGVSEVAAIFLNEVSKPAGLGLALFGLIAFGYLFVETFRLAKVARERMLAALVLIFFQLLFFAFFEQAGSSTNNFTDRNVDRVGEIGSVTSNMVGKVITLEPTQEQLGFHRGNELFSQSVLDKLRELAQSSPDFTITWPISDSEVGMHLAKRVDEVPATLFQAVNPTFILIFALLFNLLWAYLRSKGRDVSAPLKFAIGLLQLGLGFGAYWMGAETANDRGMVNVVWLLLGYLLQTTGELCLSPVGLSAMTKMAPKVLVSTLMGAWFLAGAFSQYLSAIISQFTGVKADVGGELPAPRDTVHIYGDVFGKIALAGILCGVFCALLAPLLKRWMHEDTLGEEQPETRPA